MANDTFKAGEQFNGVDSLRVTEKSESGSRLKEEYLTGAMDGKTLSVRNCPSPAVDRYLPGLEITDTDPVPKSEPRRLERTATESNHRSVTSTQEAMDRQRQRPDRDVPAERPNNKPVGYSSNSAPLYGEGNYSVWDFVHPPVSPVTPAGREPRRIQSN